MRCLTLHFEDAAGHKSKIEVHMLNPGQTFPRFGGSSRGLVVGKTASLITSTFTVGRTDVEQDIHAPKFWEWIARIINGEIEAKVTATVGEAADEKAA